MRQKGRLVSWRVGSTTAAVRDARKVAGAGFKLDGACSRRINIHHRLVYQILDDVRVVKVLRMWTHYE